MVNLVPGFIWTPIDVGERDARRKGRGVIGHVAVSNSKNLVPGGSPTTRQSDWHCYLPKIGPARQYIDLDLQSWSSFQANPDTVAWESEGGMGTAAQINAEPWTEDQLNNAAILLRHMHDTEGVPFADMGNSLYTSRGHGVHRYGIDPWRISGGQKWSTKNGKLCPGDAKVAQVGEIVRRARGAGQIFVPSPVAWTPAPTPAPAPAIPPVPGLPAWDLPVGHWFGNKAGGVKQHGGFYIGERDNVIAIQRKLIALGCVPGVTDWRSGWADGLWENATDDACRRWFGVPDGRPQQRYTDRIYSDDYAVLARQ